MMPAIERTTAQHGRPTYYETLLALAFAYFAEERVDVGVIEVGLGGRLDGTNVLHPVVAAITSVGYDHTDVLGTTLEAIARREGRHCQARRTAGRRAGAACRARRDRRLCRRGGRAGRPCRRRRAGRVRIARAGPASNARATHGGGCLSPCPAGPGDLSARQRRHRHRRLGTTRPRTAPEGRRRRARICELGDRRADGAFFGYAGRALRYRAQCRESGVAGRFAARKLPRRRVHYVVAIGESKDARSILEILAGVPATFTFTSFAVSGRRAMAPGRLATMAESLGRWGRAIDDPVEAFSVARRTAAIEDVIVVTGSTFVVAALREWFAPTAV